MPKGQKISYEIEANVLRIEIVKWPIDHAKVIGNLIINFSKEGLPVYIEMLEASDLKKKFLAQPQPDLPLIG